jgi:hypothetical protein
MRSVAMVRKTAFDPTAVWIIRSSFFCRGALLLAPRHVFATAATVALKARPQTIASDTQLWSLLFGKWQKLPVHHFPHHLPDLRRHGRECDGGRRGDLQLHLTSVSNTKAAVTDERRIQRDGYDELRDRLGPGAARPL